jgi:hypothetical protein
MAQQAFNVQSNELARTMTTFSGCDIKAYFENVEIGNLQGISLSVNREVRPVFVMGRTDVLSYSRGKRGVAGSIILTILDRDALHDIKRQALFAAKSEDLTQDTGVVESFGSDLKRPNYSDQIPPFVCFVI